MILTMSKHVLVIRFSSLGDVAMTVPVIKNVLDQHPELHITVVSNSFMAPLFSELERCHFFPAFLKGRHKGFAGVIRLFTELRRLEKFDAIADLHDVLRSKILSILFEITGIRTARIDKGRKEKRELTRKHNKKLRPLKTTHERYADVFRKVGLSLLLSNNHATLSQKTLPPSFLPFATGKKMIGIAPFAKYEQKMYPLSKMKTVVEQISKRDDVQILFFGGNGETETLEEWAASIHNSFNTSGKFSFAEELSIISNLKLMISMDSANLHLASLFNVPVVSIWGPTHPYAGFAGWGQSPEHIVQLDLPCRPSSVFGDKACTCGDHACMTGIPEELIIKKIESLL